VLERFTPAARQALEDARAEAGLAGQAQIHSEHMLIGLVCEPGPAAEALSAAGLDAQALRARLPRGPLGPRGELDAEALASLGIDLDAVRRATDAAFGPGALDRTAVPGRRRLRFADDARQTLADAVRHASKLGQHTISTGHLLIGIIDQQNNAAYGLLAQAGADVPALRADVLRRISAAA
jgi:ATP-dependent Clp protease ATP-binding subunit ClpA